MRASPAASPTPSAMRRPDDHLEIQHRVLPQLGDRQRRAPGEEQHQAQDGGQAEPEAGDRQEQRHDQPHDVVRPGVAAGRAEDAGRARPAARTARPPARAISSETAPRRSDGGADRLGVPERVAEVAAGDVAHPARYCCGSGLSSPRLARAAASSSSVKRYCPWPSEAICASGSPGHDPHGDEHQDADAEQGRDRRQQRRRR